MYRSSESPCQTLRCSPPLREELRQVSVATLPSALSVMGVCMPGASWVLLDSAGAATCSAASLAITADGSRQTRKTQSPNSALEKSDLCGEIGRCSCLVQWLVYLAGDPEMMQNYRQLPRNTDESSLLAERSST
jgi:hypothetical protein